jgi:hypothetical protein
MDPSRTKTIYSLKQFKLMRTKTQLDLLSQTIHVDVMGLNLKLIFSSSCELNLKLKFYMIIVVTTTHVKIIITYFHSSIAINDTYMHANDIKHILQFELPPCKDFFMLLPCKI